MSTTTKPISKDYLLQTLKDFEAKILRTDFIEKFETMPAVTVDDLGKIAQYVGVTTVTAPIYTNGYFYQVIENPDLAGSYIWTRKDVQEAADGILYSIVQEATPDAGYFATYQLYGATTGGTPVPISGSAKINIPRDFLVKSGEVKTVTAADKAAGGIFYNNPDFLEGDKYIDFVVNVKDSGTAPADEHIYINVKDLVDTYSGGDGIAIDSSTKTVTLDLTTNGGLQLTGTTPNKTVGVKLDTVTSNQIELHLGTNGLYGTLILADPDDPDEAIDFDHDW